MQKHMHDILMDKGFGGESIGINLTQLFAKNGRVYTPTWHREFFIFLKEG